MIRASIKCQADLQILTAAVYWFSSNRFQTKVLADAHIDESEYVYFQCDASNTLMGRIWIYTERQSQQRTPWNRRVRAVSTDDAKITGCCVSG